MSGHDHGELIMHVDLAGSVVIERADPRVLIPADTIHTIRDHPRFCDSWATLNGDIVTFRDATQTVIYRITGQHPTKYASAAEWPD